MIFYSIFIKFYRFYVTVTELKHGKRLVALFMSLSLIANHTSTVIALGDEYKRLFIEQSLNAPNITWDTKNEVIVGTAFDSMKGIKAIDDKGNDITDKVKVTGSVDTSKEGEYALTYSIADSEEEPITRVVRVIPNPEFNVSGSDYVRTYKGEEFDYKQGLTVTDSKGNDITSSVTCEGNVDINKLGSYNLKYYVPDKKEPILERTVDVIEKNVFNVYLNNEKLQKSLENYNNWLKDPNKDPNKPVSIEKDLAFSIYLDNKTSKFALENQSSEKLDVSIGDKVFANIKVFDKDNNEKLSIELLGSDTGNSEKLDKLKELTYEYGDYISIVTRDSKNCLDITGTLTGDIDNTKEDCKEYYSDGVDNLDYIKNVRFNIVKEGIKTVYNNAPVITGLTEMEKLLTTRDEQLKGISITDDKDTYIPLDEVVITEEKDGNNIIGLRYTVCDDWGREASGVRYLKNPQVNNDGRIQVEQPIQIKHEQPSTFTAEADTFLSTDIIEVHGFEYDDNDTLRFKINFDQDNMSIYITDIDGRLFDNKYKEEYFELVLYNKGGIEKARLTVNGGDRSDCKSIENFNGVNFEYGDQISIYHKYSDTKLKIKGPVKDLTTGVSTGVPASIIDGTRFELDTSGLRYLVNEPPVITWTNQNLQLTRGVKPDLIGDVTVTDKIDGEISKSKVEIGPLNINQLGTHKVTYTVRDSWGAVTTTERTVEVVDNTNLANTSINILNASGTTTMFTLRFDNFDKKIYVVNKTTSSTFDSNKPDEKAFRIRIFSRAGITKKDIIFEGKDTASKIDALNDYIYAIGDTIELWSTTSKSIRISGKLRDDNSNKETDYSDGIDDPDFMTNVRFRLDQSDMVVVYNNAPQVIFNEDKTIKRGEKFDPIKFVKEIKDDHDTLKTDRVKVSYDEENFYKVGNHDVTYTISDRWNRMSTTTITIEVQPKNELEKVNVELLKVDGTAKSTVATLYFDQVENKIVPYINTNKSSIAGEPGQPIFTVSIFDKDNRKKAESIINANEEILLESFDNIANVDITSGDYIYVSAYNTSAVSINGKVTSGSSVVTDFKNGFSSEDQMNNTRFKISDDGLSNIYNEAPVFNGAEDIIIFKNQRFEPLEGVTITDDKDINISTSAVTVKGNIDTTRIGEQHITYTVHDSWGRSIEKIRKVTVKPAYEENYIEVDNSNNEPILRIGFDYDDLRLTFDTTNGTANNTLGSDFAIVIYDRNYHLQGYSEISSTNTNISEKLQNDLRNITLDYGTKIYLYSTNSTAVSIYGNVTKPTAVTEADYSDGVNNPEFLENVLFELTEDGLNVIYNTKPSINLSSTELPNLYKGDDYKKDLTTGASIQDDHDNIDISRIEVCVTTMGSILTTNSIVVTSGNTKMFTTDGTMTLNDITEIGDYKAYFLVRDNWGKVSDVVTTDFTIVSAIDRNDIIFGGYDRNQPGTIKNTEAFRFKFDSSDMTIKLGPNPHNSALNTNAVGRENFYEIDIYTSSGTLRTRKITLGTGTNPCSTNLLNPFRNSGLGFEYGDYIHIYAFQTFRMSIDGAVRNPIETDSNGYKKIDKGDDFNNTYFEITEAGLKAHYKNPVLMSTNATLVEYDAGEGKPFKMYMNFDENTTSRQIQFPQTGGFFDYDGSSGVAFTVNWFGNNLPGSNNGTITTNRTFNHAYQETGASNDLKAFARQRGLVDGDYFTLEAREKYKQMITFKGSVNTTYAQDKDYSNGANSAEDLDYVRFYIRNNATQKCIDVLYNEAPEFIGADDINLYVGDTFNPTSGVTATDDTISGGLRGAYTVTGPDNTSASTTTFTAIGRYQYTYTVTDNWGRTTTKVRYVYVRPEVFKNRITLYKKDVTTVPTKSNTYPNGAKVAFEIGVDNYTSKYTVSNQLDEYINEQLKANTAFKISIYGDDHTEKVNIVLRGIDKGTNEKLNSLKNITYEEGDYIKVWSADSNYLKISGPITGDVTTNGTAHTEDYSDGINDPDYMNNVAFEVLSSGFRSIYNDAPSIQLKDANASDSTIELLYKEAISDLRELVEIDDNEDKDLTTSNIIVEGEVDFNKVGSYTVKYTVTDKWGRSTEREFTIKVVSHVKDNRIDIYTNGSTNSQEYKFSINFDYEHNKLLVTTNRTANITKNVNNNSTTTYFTIVVRDRLTNEKAKVEFNATDLNNTSKFNEINRISYSNGDTISLYCATPNNVKVIGDIVNEDNKQLENGYQDEAEMNNTRLKITDNGLELFQREEPRITFKDNNFKVKRGDDSTIYDGMELGFTNPDSYLGIKYSVSNFDKYKLGMQNVTYTINDSWGKVFTTQRNIEVVERLDLEKNYITIKNNINSNAGSLINIGFDTLNNKIVISTPSSTSYNQNDNSIVIFKIYDESGVTKEVFELTKEKLSTLNSDTELDYSYGDYIGITHIYDKKGFSINGNITTSSVEIENEDYSNGVDDLDHIYNVRFKITQDGLESVYNHAPKLTINGDLVTFKDEVPDLYKGIEEYDVDKHDEGLNNDNVQIDTDLDVTQVGSYNATYTLTDNWGRSVSTNRTIIVKSSLGNNKIEYYNSSDINAKPVFDISIDIENRQFKVNKNTNIFTATSKRVKTDNTSEFTCENPFELNLYNSNSELKEQIIITSIDTIDTLTAKLDEFNDKHFEYGDYISVKSSDYKHGIKIKGNIEIPYNIKEDYSDGIDNLDYMNNVRFRIDEDELVAIYNEAPRMIFSTSSTLEYYKGDTPYPGEGVKILDDNDIDLSSFDVYIPDYDKHKLEVLGTTDVTICITDNWGRSSQATRRIEVKNALSRNAFHFGGYDGTLSGDKNVKTMFKISFDTSNQTITVSDQQNKVINTNASRSDYYVIRVYNRDNQEVAFAQLGTDSRPTENQSLNGLKTSGNIKDCHFEYGWYMKIYAFQTFRMAIDGAVRNGAENYADGVNRGEAFNNTKFIFTEEGLKAEYTNPTLITTSQSLIEYNAGEGKPFKMIVNHDTGQVTFPEDNIEGFYDYDSGQQIVFKLHWYDSQNSSMMTFSYKGQQQGVGQELQNFVRNRGNKFYPGDYLIFETPYKDLSKCIELSGKIIKPTSCDSILEAEDFSDGIDNQENMTRTIFYYNKNNVPGFTIEKRLPATILGAEDIAIPQNSTFSVTSGVTVIDCDNTDITSQMTITMNGQDVTTSGNFNTSRIGLYEVTYKVTNKYGIQTVVYRNISVYSESTLSLKDANAKNIIEQGSYNNSTINSYLLSLVQANDPDDGNITSKVTVVSHNINFEQPGIYYTTYAVTNSFGKTTTLSNVEVEVIRTISVDVPIKVPFQIVTNLIDKNDDPFVAGTLNLRNNKTSDVKVYLDGFVNKNSNGGIEIVTPGTTKWDELTTEDTMKKMALGIYNKEGFKKSSYQEKDKPLWLHTGITSGTTIGTLERAPSLTSPSTAKIGFNSKHGKKFRGGTTRGKFELIFRFE